MYVFKLKISVERLMEDRIEGGGGRNVTFRGEGCLSLSLSFSRQSGGRLCNGKRDAFPTRRVHTRGGESAHARVEARVTRSPTRSNCTRDAISPAVSQESTSNRS